MPDRSPFSHILFDLDRTLAYYPLPTAEIVAQTFARLELPLDPWGSAAELGGRYDDLWVELEREAASVSALRRAVWDRVLAERGQPAPGLAERVADAYGLLRAASGIRLFDGADALLRDLRAAGFGLGLLTNGCVGQWEKIHALGVEPLFDAVAVAGDLRLYKPDARAFSSLLDRLGARPAATLFVGDSYELDIVGAHGAGMSTAWIRPAATCPPGDVVPDFGWESVLELREVVL